MLALPLAADESAIVQRIADEDGITIDIEAERLRPWARVWTARFEPGQPPVAFLVAWAVADELHLIQIATRPDARRKGAARCLMDTLLSHARDRRASLVLLEVRRGDRAALGLYRGFRFSAIGVRREYYSDGQDAIEMRLCLDPETGAVQPARDEVELRDT